MIKQIILFFALVFSLNSYSATPEEGINFVEQAHLGGKPY